MRKITSNACDAFMSSKKFKSGNTEVVNVTVPDEDIFETLLKLYGHTIAIINSNGRLQISNAGWPTATTKERLNGLPGVSIHQKNGQWFLNGNAWNGHFTTIE